jgi:hypothetical protein
MVGNGQTTIYMNKECMYLSPLTTFLYLQLCFEGKIQKNTLHLSILQRMKPSLSYWTLRDSVYTKSTK